MARNYDEMRAARDLEFVIGGQMFTLHLLPLTMVGVWTEREKDVDTADTPAFTMMCIDRVADAINDGNGSEERWRDLCASAKGPSYGELLELARWAWEVQSDLPMTAVEPSAAGPGTTAFSSRGA